MGSHIHPMFGSVCAWLFRDLAGLKPVAHDPGFHTVLVDPHPVRGLAWVRAEHTGPFGLIQSAWHWHGQQLALNITIPPASAAFITLPGADHDMVQCNGRPLASGAGGVLCRQRGVGDNATQVVHVGPGQYQFIYAPHNPQ